VAQYFKKIERTRNTKEKKHTHIGLSEMHNIFVAADEEKRKKIMKKQLKYNREYQIYKHGN
jgi:hypothetical protein